MCSWFLCMCSNANQASVTVRNIWTWVAGLQLVRSRVPSKVSMTSMSSSNHWKPTQTVFLFQPGVTYAHPGQDTSAGLAPSAVGFTNHNLGLSHNNPVASESSSSEILRSMLSAKSVTKRAVADAAQHDKVPRPVGFVPLPPPCPGKIHHFDI